jgi:hypothetical protein
MPMSDDERRLLKELELGLIADDPHLAMELLSGYPAPRLRADLFCGAICCSSPASAARSSPWWSWDSHWWGWAPACC